MNRWASWAVPQVKFAARGGRQEKFLTLCMEKGVPLSRVKPAPGGFEAWVPARYYRALRKDARRCRTRLKVCQKRGLAFSLGWLKGRWGLAAGVVLFWLVLNLSGRLVWSIQYKGVGQQQAEQLSALLYSMDIGEGSVLTQEVLDAAQRELFRHTDELGWVALNFEKGRLTVEAEPARPTPGADGGRRGTFGKSRPAGPGRKPVLQPPAGQREGPGKTGVPLPAAAGLLGRSAHRAAGGGLGPEAGRDGMGTARPGKRL